MTLSLQSQTHSLVLPIMALTAEDSDSADGVLLYALKTLKLKINVWLINRRLWQKDDTYQDSTKYIMIDWAALQHPLGTFSSICLLLWFLLRKNHYCFYFSFPLKYSSVCLQYKNIDLELWVAFTNLYKPIKNPNCASNKYTSSFIIMYNNTMM